ncbi:response regulator transcription factor [Bdellovibrio sp. HCB337]|uniref:response regulator transcription factor n=1 Tax=Bdellovibrio sp. HCB337 TaxID=3394358 RepID=UPI0039A40603
MRQILLVEDDKSLGETLTERLSKEYRVLWAQSVQAAKDTLAKEKGLDLVILDLGLPDGTGFEVAEYIRAANLHPLFIFLTAQADAEARLKGFEIGAEEFIPKPFHLKELLIRVKHVLDQHAVQSEIEIEGVSINFTTMAVRKVDGQIEYPPVTDLKILQFLIERAPRAVSRDEIINEVWGLDKNPSHRTIDNTIVRLRQLIGEKGESYIRSVRGVGYQWFKES